MYKSIISLTSLLALASAAPSARSTCEYPAQTEQKAPASSKACVDGVQTFALQAVNCSDPYNGYFIQYTTTEMNSLPVGIWQLAGSGDIAQFYLNGTTLEPVSSTTPDPSQYNKSTPIGVSHGLDGRGGDIPNGPIALITPDENYYEALVCKISDGYLHCYAPVTPASTDYHLYFGTNLNGMGGPSTGAATIYIANAAEVDAPYNPNDDGYDHSWANKLKVVKTCKL